MRHEAIGRIGYVRWNRQVIGKLFPAIFIGFNPVIEEPKSVSDFLVLSCVVNLLKTAARDSVVPSDRQSNGSMAYRQKSLHGP